jgi:riboflavin biosynthesis pyrimidine reductase
VKATPNNRNPRPQPHFVGNSLLMPATDGFDPKSILEVLHDQGYKRILIEGGGNTVSRFLQADAVDRLHITVAPLLIGSGQVALMMDPIESLDQALRPTCRHFRLGRDILFDLNLRQQASSSSTSVSRE